MRQLLDTVTFIWALREPERLSRRARRALEKGDSLLEISAVSIAEIAIKQSCGKLDLGRSEVLDGLADLRLRVLPFASHHAIRMFGLPMHHRDPFDRQIVAQSLVEEIPVITADEKFRLYDGIIVEW